MSTKHERELHSRIRSQHLRMTVPRRSIIKVLSSTVQHLSAEEVYKRVHRTHPTISLKTVYRTLDILAAMGVVARLHFGDGKGRYELNKNPQKPEHHHHLVCTVCKRVIEYDDFMEEEVALIRKLEKQLSLKHRFDISDHMIQFYGQCQPCRGRS